MRQADTASPRELQAREPRGWILGFHAVHRIDAGGRRGLFRALRGLGERRSPPNWPGSPATIPGGSTPPVLPSNTTAAIPTNWTFVARPA